MYTAGTAVPYPTLVYRTRRTRRRSRTRVFAGEKCSDEKRLYMYIYIYIYIKTHGYSNHDPLVFEPRTTAVVKKNCSRSRREK
jgi:hypothetical protein